MPRLIDLLRTRPVQPAQNPAITAERRAQIMEWMLEDAESVPAIVIDNVAEWWESDERTRWDISDIPNAAPPWRLAWFEYRFTRGSQWRQEPLRFDGLGYWVDGQAREAGGWSLQMWPFALSDGGNSLTGPLAGCTVEVAEDGSVEVFTPLGFEGDTDNEGAYAALNFTVPVLLAMSFAHCRNVEDEVINPPQKVSEAHRRRHGKPLTRYHVLRIDPMRKVLETEGHASEVGAPRALHICRGHFKTFDRKPLFGKVRGTYWWPDQVRGRAEHGTVVKDYVITSGTDGTSARAVARPEGLTAAWASPEHALAVERFSVAHALDIVAGLYPGATLTEEAHSNPGYDISVRDGDEVVQFVEVKGTTAASPGFHLTEVERRFSVENGARYSLVVIADIDLDGDTFTPYVHHGPVDESFDLRPTGWVGTFPAVSP